MRIKGSQAGFTLVEIAIVLVIIGLLLGGILKGQEMITQARIKNAINDFNGITVAYFPTRTAIACPRRRQPGQHALGGLRTRPGGTVDGDGNGVIAGKYMATPADHCGHATAESNNFWWHLRLAGFVAGATSGVAAWSQPVNAVGGLVGVQSGAPGAAARPA